MTGTREGYLPSRWQAPRGAGRRMLVVATGLLLCGCAPARTQTLDRTRLELTFEESFSGPALDRKRWITRWFFGDPDAASSRRSKDASLLQDDYLADDAPQIVPGGGLDLVVRRQTNPAMRGSDGAAFLTAAITTEESFAQRYGYFEARITAPAEPGLWPAFWLYDAPVPDRRALPPFGAPGAGRTREWRDTYTGGLKGEIDVVEILTQDPATAYYTAFRRLEWVGRPGGETRSPPVDRRHFMVRDRSPATVAHTYGVLWTQDRIVWYRDDLEVARTANPGLHAPMYLIVSMATGGWNGNYPDPGFKKAAMRVDFVKAYRIR
jgi:hypothetical protein